MHALMLHRTCDAGPVRAVTAKVEATADGCDAEFRLHGDIDKIVIPEPGPSIRTDNLWQGTCFEFFWQPIGNSRYREFNLSPSGKWAAYDFADYRDQTGDLPVDAISVAFSRSRSELVVNSSVAADLPTPAQVALTSIIENADGALQYWALAFAPGKPDFHSEACRQIIVDRD